ncbi:UPF0103-domain-containing protein [Delitschia confertaspora ATCC 74209]|uniref:UPF0103-domain-containing protein n=1 Tax=Delitschia confertaspora ATCC 74209 TaxID=1513339 RepID=A0A9P4JLV9_9PLEO|nr:UPF0103-domain-containing protein [Delitschia confertaspora ATCC 74209]
MSARQASHAGSWYSSNKQELSDQLDEWLSDVPSKTTPIGTASSKQGELDIPSTGARAVIAPHAGYAYSGPAAAWAYKALDWSKANRIFLLGPSHHHYLSGCALTQCSTYKTPLGDLRIDTDTVQELHSKGKFDKMSRSVDEAEHSLEMHLPYIYKMLSLHLRNFSSPSDFPPLIPILVGATLPKSERTYGALLAPYLSDPTSIFILSSDFCHWGSRFHYTYYAPPNTPVQRILRSTPPSSAPKIYESIAHVDQQSMDAVESGSHGKFVEELDETGNTVCGRHPIGVFLAAVEELGLEEGKGRMRFVRYERSGDVVSVRDSSVSYCSAFAVF